MSYFSYRLTVFYSHVCLVSVFRFADVFGARAALSVSCLASVVYFLLLVVADNTFMLFVHKLPAVFMHALPGNTYTLTYTILPKVLGHPLLMNRFDYFSHFHEYKSECLSI